MGVFFGGLPIAKDEAVLKTNCPHIVVGTPGRILGRYLHLLGKIFLMYNGTFFDPVFGASVSDPDPDSGVFWIRIRRIFSVDLYLKIQSTGLWIRILFLRIRIQLFFSMRIRI